jgi:transcriptional regulator with XRE-family HTH domain
MAPTVEDGSGKSADSGLGRYLRARRAEITPDQAGLTAVGMRRTPGLRREELATLAGISIDYYIRLERGKEFHPSPSVRGSLAQALRLVFFAEPDSPDQDKVTRLDEGRPQPRARTAKRPMAPG